MMGYNGSPNKYVCPNDRQLSLRAKLRTGWCVPRGVSPLTPAEQAAILEVIRRSEALGLAEARRVGRLVDRVESLRRSAPPALAGGAPRCRACSRRAPLLTALRACSGCKNHFCGRCCAETAVNSDRWLCNLCSETREMWKKSGAWFYHGLPQYILPERRDSSGPGTSTSSIIQTSSRESFHQDSLLRRGSCVASYRSMSALQESADNDLEPLQHGFSGLSLNRMESFSQRSGSGLRRTPSKGSSRSLASSPSHSALQTSPLGTIDQNTVYTGSSVPYGQSNLTANGQPSTSTTSFPLCVAPGECGSAEVRLQHDSSDGTLHCTAVRARGLPSTDLAGLADPYCCMEILPPEGTACNRIRTKTVHKTRNPEFNETVTFYGITESDLDSKTFRITLFDEDKYGCDILGSASLPLAGASVAGGRPQDLVLPLSAEETLGERLMKAQLLVSLCYNTKKRALAVLVCRCRNLPAMDSNGFSDPFVKLHLEPDPYHRKHKTSIKWRNLNPIYNEEFFFETRPTELTKQSLALTVWDKDYGKPNDFLGSLVIGSASKGKRLKHWLDCIKFPDHRHEQWHCLTDTEP